MPFWDKQSVDKDTFEQLAGAVLAKSAVIWFSPDGEILDCNENFCAVMGYARDEIVGKKHALFVDQHYAKSPEYKRFWTQLRDGKALSDTFQRVAKGGGTRWIEASYVPITDKVGKVAKVVKFATDVTSRIEKAAEDRGHLAHLITRRRQSNSNWTGPS